jgi:hypothetical protein
MADKRYQEIVRGLLDATNQNKVEWKEAARPDSLQVSFPNYTLVLGKRPNQRDRTAAPDYVISIINFSGTTIDSFSDVELDEGAGDQYFETMAALFDKARRQALGVEQALEEVLKELKQA